MDLIKKAAVFLKNNISFLRIGLISKTISKIIHSVGFIIFLAFLYNLSKSSLEGGFTLIEKTKDGGYKVGNLKTMIKQPERKTPNVIVGFGVSSKNEQYLDLSKHVTNIYGFEIYGTTGVVMNPVVGNTYKLGVSIAL